MTTNENELDSLLSRLRDAEKAGDPPEVLSQIRQRITAAADAEARAREAQHEDEELAARGPGFKRGDGQPEPPVLFLPEEVDSLTVGASRFGGLPDLPRSFAWPEHDSKKLPFLAQLDLSSLPATRLLPKDGWLVVFARFEDQDHRSYPLFVRHIACDRSELVRAQRPGEDDIWADWSESVYDLVPLKLRVEPGLKPVADYGDKNCCGWLLGEVDEFWGTAGSLAYDSWHSGDDWINLLAIDSVGSMQWSDCGHLYLLARRQDLIDGDLSKVIACICST